MLISINSQAVFNVAKGIAITKTKFVKLEKQGKAKMLGKIKKFLLKTISEDK